MQLGEEEACEELRWLLDCHARAYLVTSSSRPRLPPALSSNVGAGRFPIAYAPRSLTIDPRAPRVAVGTKAGTIHLATWRAAEEDSAWRLEMLPQRERPLPAVRGLAFIGEDRLVAGWGPGHFSIFMVGGVGSERHDVRMNQGGPQDDESRWMRRFKCVVPLSPRTEATRSSFLPLALGLTPGSDLHLLSHDRASGAYEASTEKPETLIRGWERKWGTALDAAWGRHFLRIDDTVKECGVLWLLSARGYVVRCDVGADGRLSVGCAMELDVREEVPRFSNLDACAKGLAVRASQHVTFVRLKKSASGPEFDLSRKHSWLPVPNIRTCAAYYPGFSSTAAPWEASADVEVPIERDNPVWVVASTSRDEIVWSSWWDADDEQEIPYVLPQRFPGVAGGALHVRCGGPDVRRAFLVFASQDNQLRIVPTLDRRACNAEIRRLLVAGQPIPGGSFWEWKRHLRRGSWDTREGPPSTDALSEDNLRALVAGLLGGRDKRRAPGETLPTRASRQFVISVLLRILQRAQAFGPALLRELAAMAFELIAKGRGRGDEKRDVSDAMWEEFGVLAGFLRKWIVRGHTYGANTLGLDQLYRWNERCGRDLDAMVYLARLLEHRVDRLWEASAAEATVRCSTWDVACDPPPPDTSAEPATETPFVLSSLTDGSLRATSGNGRALVWRQGDGVAASIATARLCISVDGLSLRHVDAEEFEQKHRHGPYARSLLMRREADPEGNPFYLMVFGLRGWRATEREPDDGARKPRLYALWVRTCLAERGEDGRAGIVIGLEIIGLDVKVVEDEIYGFCEIDVSPERREMLAGTSGVWNRMLQPFVAITISRGVPGQARPELQVRNEPRVATLDTGRRSLLLKRDQPQPGTEYNPCWALATASTAASGKVVWAGFQDGDIKRFERLESGAWQEGIREGDRPRAAGIKVSAAVWSLRMIGDEKLAYGTGDGTVGLIEVAELEKKVQRSPPCHIVHAREAGPVCGLVDFRDAGNRMLMAVTESGAVSLFDLDGNGPLGSPAVAGRVIPDRAVRLPGFRLDRFSLGIIPRAVAPAAIRAIGSGHLGVVQVPTFVFGSMDGALHLYTLHFPPRSRRRREAMDKTMELLDRELRVLTDSEPRPAVEDKTTPPLAACVPAADGAAWLRLFDVGEVSVTKAALWWELRPTLPPAKQRWTDPVAGAQLHLACLKRLTDEIYQKQPFRREPARVLWELASRTAHGVAKQLVPYFGSQPLDERGDCLVLLYRELHIAIDDLCNRWIGFEQASEARVLADSFETSFDGLAVLALATCGAGENLRSLRAFLLRSVIERRLSHSDPLVPLESLRVLNDALVTVLDCRGSERDWCLCMRDVEDGGEGPGFYDLMILVGDLGERMGPRLNPGEPLYTELARFFALSVLLLPESSLIVAQVLSESRLTEPGLDIAAGVLHQLQYLRRFWSGRDEIGGLDQGRYGPIALFEAYFDSRFDFDLHRGAAPRAPEGSRVLLEAANEGARDERARYTNREFLHEARIVLLATSALARLSSDQASEQQVKEFTERTDPATVIYFQHSQRYLQELEKLRDEIRDTIKGVEAGRPGSGEGGPIEKAIEMCESKSAAIGQVDLFFPQREHFAALLGQWRKQLVQYAESAVGVLRTLDQYNRHVHRSSADALMNGVLDLVMQAVPLSFDEEPSRGSKDAELWREALMGPRRPLIRRRLAAEGRLLTLFDCADRIVDSTHLGGSLLTLACASLVPTGKLLVHTVALSEVYERIRAAGEERGLEVTEFGIVGAGQRARRFEEVNVPGTYAFWEVIAREVAANMEKHDQGNVLHMQASVSGGREAGSVWIAGKRPFFDILPKEMREQWERNSNTDEVDGQLREVAATLPEPGVRYGEPSRGSGMGLTLIRQLAVLCNLHLKCTLKRLDSQPPTDVRQLPCPESCAFSMATTLSMLK